jgi:peroxiredoxin
MFRQRAGLTYPVAIDTNGETAHAYAVSALPTLFVIDKRGTVRDVLVGFDPGRDAALEKLITTLLAEPAPSGALR